MLKNRVFLGISTFLCSILFVDINSVIASSKEQVFEEEKGYIKLERGINERIDKLSLEIEQNKKELKELGFEDEEDKKSDELFQEIMKSPLPDLFGTNKEQVADQLNLLKEDKIDFKTFKKNMSYYKYKVYTLIFPSEMKKTDEVLQSFNEFEYIESIRFGKSSDVTNSSAEFIVKHFKKIRKICFDSNDKITSEFFKILAPLSGKIKCLKIRNVNSGFSDIVKETQNFTRLKELLISKKNNNENDKFLHISFGNSTLQNTADGSLNVSN